MDVATCAVVRTVSTTVGGVDVDCCVGVGVCTGVLSCIGVLVVWTTGVVDKTDGVLVARGVPVGVNEESVSCPVELLDPVPSTPAVWSGCWAAGAALTPTTTTTAIERRNRRKCIVNYTKARRENQLSCRTLKTEAERAWTKDPCGLLSCQAKMAEDGKSGR